ncbi:MAG TPA: DegT/DnrJ/EryC1/StrS family aminotransferase [Solirubrobacteraceae bacterium]|nr:DegT/DnrJ/EryC1/StrS family aminotransferase [Solirubrobacteraceae bacterium]
MQELTTRQDQSPSRAAHKTRGADPRDPLGLAPDAPLFAAYLECLDRFAAGEAPFQTPGHKGSTALTGVTVAGDHPLAGGLDTIKLTHGTLVEAERRAADAYGATYCRMSTGGSTHCNQAIAMSIGAPGDEVIVSRTLHRSLLLGLVLAGLEPVWVEPQVSADTGLALGYAPETVADALRSHPGACAVLLSDPSYVGTCSDLPAHAAVAHAAGVPLIVDAAWAAHFGFHPALPPHAIGAGADAMVTSAHKTLPAYSQGALLLARTERLDASRMTRAFEALATTSPAGAILASVDASRALLVRDGEALLGRTIAAVAGARARLREIDGLQVLDGPLVDPVKLTISLAGTGAHGVAIERDLAEAGVPVELADRDTIVALVTLADEPAAIERLTEALTESIERRRGTPRTISGAAGWIVSPRPKASPREAFFGRVETVPFSDAAGRVSAELIALYPPGVPVLAPGEEITGRELTSLSDAARDGVRVAYANDPTLATIQVLA